MFYIDEIGFENEKFDNLWDLGEWLIDNYYDLPLSFKEDLAYSVGEIYGKEEEDIELEKGDLQYDENYRN